MEKNKYFYKGKTLAEYCKENNINISTIRARIWKKRKNNKYNNYTDEQIIEMVIKAYGTLIKYTYMGIPLNQYCKNNNLNFPTIISRINRLKKENSNATNEELVSLALENFDNKNYKYYYEGMPLVEYCKKHPEISYTTIKSYIQREKERYPHLEIEEIIENYINKEHKGRYKLYYQGIPLKQYCEENDIKYKNILGIINRNENKTIEEIMKNYEPHMPKYMYNGVTLRQYCENNNLSYYSVVSFFKRKLAFNPNLNIDQLIDEAIKTINRYGIIYYYKEMPLFEYCKNNNISYKVIRNRIFRLKRKKDYINYSNEELVEKALKDYKEYQEREYYFNKLKEGNNTNDDLTEICNYFKLDEENLKKLCTKMDRKKALYLLFYFGIEENIIGKKQITGDRVNYIEKLINKVKNATYDEYMGFEPSELLGLYKCKFYDTREILLKQGEKHMVSLVYSICDKYEIAVNKRNYDEFMSEMNNFYLNAIENFNSNYSGAYINYVNKYIKGSFINYVKEYKKLNKELILNSNVFDDGEEETIDLLESKNTGFERLFDEDDFGEDILKSLSKLNNAEYKFIMLRFKDNYSYEELANMFNVGTEKIIRKEKNILNKLKEDSIIASKVKSQ